MTRDPARIDVNSTFAEAMRIMQTRGIRKILLIRDGAPVGILPLLRAQDMNPKAMISQELSQKKLIVDLPALVRRDATFSDVKRRLLDSPAVLVVDNLERPTTFEGIVTPTDMLKARPRF